jgi:1-phosphatidylinositol phosphodiesterase
MSNLNPNQTQRPFGTVAPNGEDSQQHNFYLDADGTISDLWYDGTGDKEWHYQNLHQLVSDKNPPKAKGEPFSTYAPNGGDAQQHNFYLGADGTISDLWFAGTGDKKWHYQNLHALVKADNPPTASSVPSSTVAPNGADSQQHNFYLDANGKISDIWYDGTIGKNWRYQCLHDLVPNAPLAASEPFSTWALNASTAQQHNLFLEGGNIIDIYFDGNGHWIQQNLQQLAASANPPQSVSGAFGLVASDANAQQHNLYFDTNNNISDIWYTGSEWAYQCLNTLVSGAPSAASQPVGLVVYDGSAQQHNVYRSAANKLCDIWYTGTGWAYQCLHDLVTGAPTAQGRPFSLVVTNANDEQHNLYLDVNGNISDIWYTGSGWAYQCLTYSGINGSLNNWLSRIDGSKNISELSIPGTHESCAIVPAWNAQCQASTIIQQLNSGARFLDIRLQIAGSSGDNYLTAFHDSIPELIHFGEILQECLQFLEANPTEFILMSVKNEGDTTNQFQDLLMDTYLNKVKDKCYLGNEFPTVDEVRGKIVLFSRYIYPNPSAPLPDPCVKYGIDCRPWFDNTTFTINRVLPLSPIHVQDHYQLSGSDMQTVMGFVVGYPGKITAIENQIDAVEKGALTDLYINFCSASDDGLSAPTKIAEYVNPRINNALQKLSNTRVGIMNFDFPENTPDIISNVIRLNFPMNAKTI